MTVDIVRDAHADVGEGPVWDARTGELFWVDIMRGDFWTETLSDIPARKTHLDTHVGAVLPAANPGELLLVVRDGFVRHDRATGVNTALDAPLADLPRLRFNDAKVSPDGRAFATTMPYELGAKPGALFRLDDGGRATSVFGGLGLGNGIGWSRAGDVMYFIDSWPSVLYRAAYDRATGALDTPEPLIRAALPTGTVTDGMCVDDDDCLWVAIMGGARLERYRPDGTLDRTVALPVRSPTSVCFAGARLDTLIVTSLSHGYTAADHAADPHAGALLAIAGLGVTGPPATPWNPDRIGV